MTETNEAMERRTELHMLTEMSEYAGVSGIREILEETEGWDDIAALAITDINSVQAFPDAAYYGKDRDIKLIYGMTVTAYHFGDTTPCVLIARNEAGKHNLFRIVTEAYKKDNAGNPVIEWDYLQSHKEGVYIGASCDGEVTKAVCEDKTDDEIKKIISGYDYIEIQPCENMLYVNESGNAEDMTRRIVKLAYMENKLVVAVSNAAFIYPEDQLCHEVLTDMDPHTECDQRSLYIRGTSEMLEEFAFLGANRAREVVLDNPNKIADECEEYNPITEKKYILRFTNEDKELEKICYESAYKQYGKPLPDIVEKRLIAELSAIRENGYSGIYLFWKLLTDKSKEMGYPTGSRGSVGASLVACFSGITDVNPLPAHYYCPKCHRFELLSSKPEDYWYTGYDIPVKSCPNCGTDMKRDGFNIPFELFSGLNNDKEPDIDINFASNIQNKIIQYAGEYFGEDNVVRAGTISTITEKTAAYKLYEYAEKTGNNRYACFFQMRNKRTHHFDSYGLVYDYHDEMTGIDRDEFIKSYREWESDEEELVKKVSGTRKSMGVHPGGIIVVPDGTDMTEITPVQYKRILDRYVKITHLDYHAIDWNVMKFDVLGHDSPTILHELERETGIGLVDIPYDDEKVLSLFQSAEALGFRERKLNGRSCFGTLGIPEFGSVFVWEILASVGVERFSDLMRVSALQHGTGCWEDNAEILAEDGRELKDMITYRDDIMLYLESKGIDQGTAFKMMENTRKGKRRHLADEEGDSLMKEAGIPKWYIDSTRKIAYLFPKAHTVSYVKMAWKLAYYKLYYPQEFYQEVLRYKEIPNEIRREPDMLDLLIMHMEMDDEITYDEREELRNLYILAEARDRGCDIKRILEHQEG